LNQQPSSPERCLANRIAVVTGASRGLGRAIAEAMWQAGASLFVAARSGAALDQFVQSLKPHLGQRAHSMRVDLGDPAAPAALHAEFRRHFDRVDILINNAGIQGPIGLAWKNEMADWRSTMQVNLLAPVDLCRLFVPMMIERRGGKIINVSGGGAANPRPHVSAYATAKAALVRFSETLAEETREYGIDVNCISPGAMISEQTRDILNKGEAVAGKREYAQITKLFQTGGTKAEIPAKLCVHLASDACNGITGKMISAVWDPWTDFESRREDLASTDIYTLRRIVPEDRGRKWS
jgi:3-oxoacyl-[acyl-carrier protein] reductase